MDLAFGALPTLIQWLLILSALIVAVGTIYRKAIKPIAEAIIAVHKTYERQSGFDARIRRIETFSKELVNNSGSSLRDAVDRIEVGQVAQARALSDHVDWGRDELLKVWQNLASRDAVEAAKRTAELIHKEGA